MSRIVSVPHVARPLSGPATVVLPRGGAEWLNRAGIVLDRRRGYWLAQPEQLHRLLVTAIDEWGSAVLITAHLGAVDEAQAITRDGTTWVRRVITAERTFPA